MCRLIGCIHTVALLQAGLLCTAANVTVDTLQQRVKLIDVYHADTDTYTVAPKFAPVAHQIEAEVRKRAHEYCSSE